MSLPAAAPHPAAPLPAACDVFEAMTSRRAVRAFLPTPIPRATIEGILALASRAPSGSNIQPWKVWVVAGAAKKRLSAKILAAFEADDPSYVEDYDYYPREWVEPYLSRRRKLGKALYSLAGVAKGDQAATKRQLGRNYLFFDAPVGLFVTIDKAMSQGSWLDTGAFLMGILLAARGYGLHSCPQQSFTRYHRLIRAELGIPDSETIATGVAIGHEDRDAPENRLVTEREPVHAFANFHWDDEGS